MSSNPHPHALTARRVDDDHAFGTWNQVVIAIWRVETRPIAALELGELIGECARRNPGGIALLQVIEETARAPGAAARQALAKMHGAHASVIRRSALVFTKPGFAGAAVRAVMTGVAMLNPPEFEHQLFANIAAAVAWVDEELRPKAGAMETLAMRTAIDQLRAMKQLPSGLTPRAQHKFVEPVVRGAPPPIDAAAQRQPRK